MMEGKQLLQPETYPGGHAASGIVFGSLVAMRLAATQRWLSNSVAVSEV